MQLVQGEIMQISITIILLFNFEKKHLIRLSVSSKLQNKFPLSFYCLPCFVLERQTEKKNVKSNLNKFRLHAVAEFATHWANRHGALLPRSKV